ncbi:RING finger protein 32 [Chanos chanos]|uniref:RING finger protein 32 n=1 Tax=Chanos chanos TaxID=29144 RepID=A0A6J2VPY0_CHACN|nr:RING finger protein 32 [Chanos chanos]
MRKRESCFKVSSSKLALAAVALQDHISSSLALGLDRKSSTETRDGRVSGIRNDSSKPQRQTEEREYVLDPPPPPMTLAQRLGLVAGPSRRLTVAEWTEVKSRSVRAGDSSLPCVICREEFKLQAQVLLSCSHIFHKVCLKSYERYSGRKCCPVCRKEEYETRVIHDAARIYREKCAVKIQACYRGYVVRKWYKDVRRRVPPKDKSLRRKFFEAKFQEMSDNLVRSCDSDVEAFLADIDRSLEASRDVRRRLEWEHGSEEDKNNNSDENDDEEDWQTVQEKAIQRDVVDCPICLTPLASPHSGSATRRPVLLLSCSHLFHQPCLQAFELFCLEGRPTCPLCRAHYSTKLV